MIKTIPDIVSEAHKRGRKHLVVACAQDSHTLEAVNGAVDMKLVEATLVGNEEEIKKLCGELGVDPKKFSIIDQQDDMEAVNTSVRMVSEKRADVLMKGLVSSDKYMRGILSKEFGLVPAKGVLSHVVVMMLPKHSKLVIVSDVAVLTHPDLTQKIAMVKYLISTARLLGVAQPKVACISPSEQILRGLASSEESAILAKMGDRGQFGRAFVDGPLALDVALSHEACRIKKLKGSSVAGDADCLLFPTLDASNSFFKAMTQLTESELACMVVGTTAPCVLTSRSDSMATKLSSIALACLSAK